MTDQVTGTPLADGGSVDANAASNGGAAPASAPVDSGAQSSSAPLLSGGDAPATDPQVSAPATWPDDWRDKFAGGDEKERKLLDRYASPDAIWKKARELEKKLSSGKFRADLPENATPEQIAAYRRDMGVPEDGKYDTGLGGGFVWSDGDRENLDFFAKKAHELNMPQAEFKKSLSIYAAMQQAQLAKTAEQDKSFRQQAQHELIAEFGADYRGNMNRLESLFSGAPSEVTDKLFNARMADGRYLGDDPAVLKWFISQAREMFPGETVIPAPAGDVRSAAERLAGYQKRMSEDYPGFMRDAEAYADYTRLMNAKVANEKKGRAA
jgi:hypothetical protein